ncbi:MAG: hypothetical protein JO147_07240 [Actinobacteria bacterium]|nr:hypothetical protein [Actinomycetota bacterium]
MARPIDQPNRPDPVEAAARRQWRRMLHRYVNGASLETIAASFSVRPSFVRAVLDEKAPNFALHGGPRRARAIPMPVLRRPSRRSNVPVTSQQIWEFLVRAGYSEAELQKARRRAPRVPPTDNGPRPDRACSILYGTHPVGQDDDGSRPEPFARDANVARPFREDEPKTFHHGI